MVVKKSTNKPAPKGPKSASTAKAAARVTTTGPARLLATGADVAVRHAQEVHVLASAMMSNANKPLEYGHESALHPAAGLAIEPLSSSATASSLSEQNISNKTGLPPAPGSNARTGNLAEARVDATGQRLTTNQGVPIADNQHSLKAGLRGPTLLEDFILREKITHFDHERIPERIVHARGSAAHGYFEAYDSLSELTRAAPFAEAGKMTPVFVRFSTVAGERGSVDTARDVRGFAVKFYTDEGNWDLVGNNMPVFFIQDAIKFPDLVHAVKPEPHFGMPQASSAHDTFWDFVSLMPESTHMLMWVMSDRALPRSYRMMQGFGVHTFRLVNDQGESNFVKFHWLPKLGTHSLVWDEAAKIQGADCDFHRRDLWEAIEAGEYPEWDLALQVFSEQEAEQFPFDVLDPTKLIPEEMVPLRKVGRMVLNRNPDNFFAETEQVAFCAAHVVPGIDFSNDPLLAGRIHSYIDTQITRLGGANFHEIPINAPLAPVFNNQRDGLHRQAIHRGRVAYEPNSLGGGCPFQAGSAGFSSFPQPVQEDKVRGNPDKFADHYSQATLFWLSQSDWEQAHIIAAFRFELSKLTVPAIRERMVTSLLNVSERLGSAVAEGLGIELPAAMPAVTAPLSAALTQQEIIAAASLSLTALPGEQTIRTRKVAMLVADGIVGEDILQLHKLLTDAGAVPSLIAPRLGVINTCDDVALEASATLENSPAVLFDALVLPEGEAGIEQLSQLGQVMEFIALQYRHAKTLLALGDSQSLLRKANVSLTMANGEPDPGIIVANAGDAKATATRLIEAMILHRHYQRERDQPVV